MAGEGDERPACLPMSFFAAAAFAVTAHFLIGAVVELTESARAGAAYDLVNITACQLLVHLAFVLLIARLYGRDIPLRRLLGARAASPGAFVLAALAGAAAEVPVSFVEQAWSSRFPLSEGEEQNLARVLAAESIGAKIALVVCLAVLWPLGEELFHRGALFGRVRAGHDARTSTFATALFFTLSTVTTPRGLPSAAAVGLGLAMLRAASGSTLVSLTAHLAFWSSAVYRLFRGPSDDALTARHTAPLAVAALVFALVLAMLFRRDAASARARADDGP